MFATKDTNSKATSAGKQRSETRTPQSRTQPWLALQRSLGNSYLQDRAAGQPTFGTAPTLQRACACGGTCGDCAGKEDENAMIQTQLTVGAANDVYEQDADRVADQVMRMPAPDGPAEAASPGVAESIQRLPSGASTDAFTTDMALDRSGGQALSAETRAFMEPRFGVDFGQVRLHTDDSAASKASQLQARAFTYGSHVWLGKGESEQNNRLMAHELTHVVQQGAAAPAADTLQGSHTSAGESTIQRDPKDQCPDGLKTVTVDLVSLNGSTRDPVDDLAFANSIFRTCCVQFVLGTGISVDPAVSDPLMGGDTNLARIHSCSAVHAEEDALRTGLTTRFGLSSRIRVFYVEDMTPTERAVSFPPFCASGARAPFVDHAYVTNTGARRSLAHEFGHILLNADTHTTHPGGTDNLMEPTNTATGETLEASQCATIFSNA
jgi:hypothetical protein